MPTFKKKKKKINERDYPKGAKKSSFQLKLLWQKALTTSCGCDFCFIQGIWSIKINFLQLIVTMGCQVKLIHQVDVDIKAKTFSFNFQFFPPKHSFKAKLVKIASWWVVECKNSLKLNKK